MKDIEKKQAENSFNASSKTDLDRVKRSRRVAAMLIKNCIIIIIRHVQYNIFYIYMYIYKWNHSDFLQFDHGLVNIFLFRVAGLYMIRQWRSTYFYYYFNWIIVALFFMENGSSIVIRLMKISTHKIGLNLSDAYSTSSCQLYQLLDRVPECVRWNSIFMTDSNLMRCD